MTPTPAAVSTSLHSAGSSSGGNTTSQAMTGESDTTLTIPSMGGQVTTTDRSPHRTPFSSWDHPSMSRPAATGPEHCGGSEVATPPTQSSGPSPESITVTTNSICVARSGSSSRRVGVTTSTPSISYTLTAGASAAEGRVVDEPPGAA